MRNSDKSEPFILITKPQELVLTGTALQNLQQTGRWARFLGITGFISSAILFLFGIFFVSIVNLIYKHPTTYYRMLDLYGVHGYRFRRPPFIYSEFMIFLYTGVSIFTFFISFYIYQFGNDVKIAIANNSVPQLSLVFSKLKIFFKRTGFIVICFIIASIIVAIYLGVNIYIIRSSPDFTKPGLQ